MTYRYSNIDKNNLKWFKADNTRATLASIRLTKGALRGLSPFILHFKYPISAIAGPNGSGKSTLLAMAACAYHNNNDGYRAPPRKTSYYTFSDFFVQSSSELPPDGIMIRYGISNNKWKGGKVGLGYQVRRKSSGGKWNNYDRRVKRNVAYLGLQRVVPFFERSTHKSYKTYFSLSKLPSPDWVRIAEVASSILGRTYTNFQLLSHSKYSLPSVTVGGTTYTGFNMGAGESAVFELLISIFSVGEGGLVIVDEIEMGLHEKAQSKLMEELKKLCKARKCQIICSTHSFTILSALPPEARFFIEGNSSKTVILPEITPEYACTLMGAQAKKELDIFLEDEVARAVLEEFLPLDTRRRVSIKVIGSDSANVTLLTSRKLEGRDDCLTIFDGDKKASQNAIRKNIVKGCEPSGDDQKETIRAWVGEHLTFLGGETWPEKWLLETLNSNLEETYQILADCWGMEPDQTSIRRVLDQGLNADKHSEFWTIADSIARDESDVLKDIIRALKSVQPNLLDDPIVMINGLLPQPDEKCLI